MLAYVALFLAATVAAIPGASVERREVLHHTPAQDICSGGETLVCCGDDNKCNSIALDDRNKGNAISNFSNCSTTVACCNFQIEMEHGENWGDITNQCIWSQALGGGEGHH